MCNNVFNEMILNLFDEGKREGCATLADYALKNCGIDDIIAVAKLLCPDFICKKNYIFIKDFWERYGDGSSKALEELEQRYNYDKKQIEMCVNSWSLGDFFIGCNDELLDNEVVLKEFGEVLAYYWRKRANELFEDRNIVIKLGKSIAGEYGLTITMYEK